MCVQCSVHGNILPKRKVNHWSNRVDKFSIDDSFIIIHHCILVRYKTALAIILIGVNQKVESTIPFVSESARSLLLRMIALHQTNGLCTIHNVQIFGVMLIKCDGDTSVAWLISSILWLIKIIVTVWQQHCCLPLTRFQSECNLQNIHPWFGANMRREKKSNEHDVNPDLNCLIWFWTIPSRRRQFHLFSIIRNLIKF